MVTPTPDQVKIGRRALARMLAATAVGVTGPVVSAQAPTQTPATPDDAFLRQARQDRLDDARQIAKVPLPQAIEPAFRFKA
jgi:hypothetical protein